MATLEELGVVYAIAHDLAQAVVLSDNQLTTGCSARWNASRKNRSPKPSASGRSRSAVCDEAKLCIEVDGDSHAEQIEYDQARTAYLNELSYTVIRFTDREIFNQCEAVLQHIVDECSD